MSDHLYAPGMRGFAEAKVIFSEKVALRENEKEGGRYPWALTMFRVLRITCIPGGREPNTQPPHLVVS